MALPFENTNQHQGAGTPSPHNAPHGGSSNNLPAHPGVDMNSPLTVGQAAFLLDSALKKSEERLQPILHEIVQRCKALAQQQLQVSSSSTVPFASIKRKADSISNEDLKKQYYEPLEEVKFRIDAISEKLQAFSEGGQKAIRREEAAQLQKTLNECVEFFSRRLIHLEIANSEGWEVVKAVEKNAEKNAFLMQHRADWLFPGETHRG